MSKPRVRLAEMIAELQDDPDFILEGLLWDVTEAIARAMDRRGITRAELARRLGTTPANITQLLRGRRNMTLKSLARVAAALGVEPEIKLRVRRPASSNSVRPPAVALRR